MKSLIPQNLENNFLINHFTLMLNSFQRLLGYPLLEPKSHEPNNLVTELFYAPFALLSHNTAPDPVFNYANAQALALFELSWEDLIVLPSRLSAEPVNQAERAELLAQVSTQGFIRNYQGVRISKTGKRFKISNAIVWNLTDQAGVYQGQAAFFSEWTFL